MSPHGCIAVKMSILGRRAYRARLVDRRFWNILMGRSSSTSIQAPAPLMQAHLDGAVTGHFMGKRETSDAMGDICNYSERENVLKI